MVSANVAEMMFRPHALASGRYQAGFRFPTTGAGRLSCQEYGAIQLDAIEADITAHLYECSMIVRCDAAKTGGMS